MELLIVVAIISVLSAIAVVNFLLARERAVKAADAANLRAIGSALQNYYMDYGKLPPADREAGPFMSHTPDFVASGNGPAAGGSWDGLPWLLVEYRYISDWKTMFTPKYLTLYQGGQTIRGGLPRFHNFRYAYNSAALSSGGVLGGAGNIESGTVWMVRNLYLSAASGFYGASAPNYPADFRFPFGDGDNSGKAEHALYSDQAVRTVIGGTNNRI